MIPPQLKMPEIKLSMPSKTRIAQFVGCTHQDVSHYFAGRRHKVGKKKVKAIREYLVEAGFVKQRNKPIRIIAAQPGDHTPSSWA